MNEQATVKNKKPNGSARAVMGIAPATSGGTVPVSTIHVSYPTASVLSSCASPFRAMGTRDSGTTMDQTALIYTPTGIIVGNPVAPPLPIFDWCYSFPGTLPSGVPLSLVVSGTTGAGDRDQAVVPFQCGGSAGG